MNLSRGMHFAAFSKHANMWKDLPHRIDGARRAGAAIGLVAVATLVGKGLSFWLPHQSLPLVYLLFVFLGAVGLGTRTGLVAAFAAFLAYNFFFIPPIYTFTIADPQEVFALLVFLAVALLTGSLSGRMRDAAEMAERRAKTLTSLHDFAGRMSAMRQIDVILQATADQASHTIASEIVVMKIAGEHLEIAAAMPATLTLTTADWQAA